MKYIKTIAYHCHNCGAPVDERSTHCSYCRQRVENKSPLQGMNRQVRVFAELKNNRKVYLHETSVVIPTENPITLDCTRIESRYQERVKAMKDNMSIELEMLMRKESLDKYKFVHETGINKVSIETEGLNNAFEFECDYLSDLKCEYALEEIAKAKFNLYPKNIIGWVDKSKDIYVNDGTTCPNCGAPLRQRFGLCDYCGGWVQDFNCYI